MSHVLMPRIPTTPPATATPRPTQESTAPDQGPVRAPGRSGPATTPLTQHLMTIRRSSEATVAPDLFGAPAGVSSPPAPAGAAAHTLAASATLHLLDTSLQQALLRIQALQNTLALLAGRKASSLLHPWTQSLSSTRAVLQTLLSAMLQAMESPTGFTAEVREQCHKTHQEANKLLALLAHADPLLQHRAALSPVLQKLVQDLGQLRQAYRAMASHTPGRSGHPHPKRSVGPAHFAAPSSRLQAKKEATRTRP
jgi:hypothetical protein